MKIRNISIFLGAAIAPAFLHANEVTWDGGGSGSWDWGVAANWAGDIALETNNNSIIHFAGDGLSTGGNSWNNTGNFNTFNQIIFDSGSASFVVQGDPPVLSPNGITGSSIVNNSTNNQTLRFFRLALSGTTVNAAEGDLFFNPRDEETNNEYVYIDAGGLLGTNVRVTGGDGKTVAFNGIIVNGGGNTGGILQEGPNTLKLGRANTFSGGVVVSNGVVEAQSSGALGTGTSVVQSGGWLSLQQSVVATNAVTLAGGTMGFHFNNETSFGNYEGAINVTENSTISGANYYGGASFGSISGVISGPADKTLTINNLGRTGLPQNRGKIFLNGTSTHSGDLNIEATKVFINGEVNSTVSVTSDGQLSGDGTLKKAATISSDSAVSPGVDDGNTDILTFENGLTLAAGSNYFADIDSADGSSDVLNVIGNLDLDGADLFPTIFGTGSIGLDHTLATYTGTLTGTFAGLPQGSQVSLDGRNYTISYTGNSITLTSTDYLAWANTNITALNPSANATLGGDPDNDGSSNLQEFAFGGNPLSGSNRGLLRTFTIDTGLDGDTNPELVLTTAIRKGNIAPFVGSPLQLNVDGMVYKIEGGTDLANFNGAVSVVTPPLTGGMPDLSADPDYEYRSFRLDSSNGLLARGFLRTSVQNP